MINDDQIKALHAMFCDLTDASLTLNLYRMDIWRLWARRGLGEEDLKLVVTHLRRGIRDGKRNLGALRFSNLIERPDLFEEEVSQARAELRNARPQATPKDRVLSATGRVSDAPMADPVHASVVVEKLKAGCDVLRKWREETK